MRYHHFVCVFFPNKFQLLFLNLTVNPFSVPYSRGRWDEGYESFSFPFINGGVFVAAPSTKSPGVTLDILLKAIGYI